MRITDAMVAPAGSTEADAVIRHCPECPGPAFYVPQKVMVLSASGARSMLLWACERHPLPDTITDNPEEQQP